MLRRRCRRPSSIAAKQTRCQGLAIVNQLGLRLVSFVVGRSAPTGIDRFVLFCEPLSKAGYLSRSHLTTRSFSETWSLVYPVSAIIGSLFMPPPPPPRSQLYEFVGGALCAPGSGEGTCVRSWARNCR